MSTIVIIFLSLIIYVVSSASEEFRTYTFAKLFFEQADERCRQSISMYEDWIFAGQFIYNPNDTELDSCDSYELNIYANYPKNLDALRIMFRVENNRSGENSGRNDSKFIVHVSDGKEMDKNLELCKNCSQAYGTFITSGEALTVTFPARIPSSWLFGFTAFHTGLCHSYEYMCANKRCIFHSLSCNGYNPCGDQSDCHISPAAYATVALGGLCAVGVLILIVYMFIKSRKTFDWSSRGRQPRKFSPAKALQNVQSFTPATVSITPIQRRWSYKY